MGDTSPDDYKDGRKKKRPGRDKESRMKDLSDDESSGDSDSSFGREKSLLMKSSKGHGSKTDPTSKESKSSKDSGKLKGKGRRSKHGSSGKHKKKKKRCREIYGIRMPSSPESLPTTESTSRESLGTRIMEVKEMQDEVIMRVQAVLKSQSSSMKESIEREKYEASYTDDETQKKSSLESSGESSLLHESRDDSNQIAPKVPVSKGKNMDNYLNSSYDVENESNDSSDTSSSSSESSDFSSGTVDSNYESLNKEKILNDAKIKRMKNMREEPLKSIKVSIERKKYEKLSQVNETQGSSSDFVYDEDSPRKKTPKEDKNIELQVEFPKILNVPDKIKEKQDKSNAKKRDNPHKTLPESSTSLSESVDADSYNQAQSKEISNKFDMPKDLSIEEDSECSHVFQAETSLDINKREKKRKREKSASRSTSSSDDSSANKSNDINKASFKMGKKDDLRFTANRKESERERKFSGSSDSSDSSSDSESSASKTKYSHRSRDKKRGRDMEKTVKKDKTQIKGISSKDNRGKSSRKGHGTGKRRGLSVSSSSSSSSKSFSDSSSSTSGSSSSGSSSRSSSASKDRSSSSSSSASSSSGRRRRKCSFKTKESAKHQSRSSLNIRKKNTEPPRPKKIHVGHLSKNINKFHLYEIFGLYGMVKNIDLPLDRTNGHTPRGFAYVEYNHASDAEKALRHMDGGIIDGQKITIAPVLVYKPRPAPPRRMSPNRRPFTNWRYTPPFRNRGGGAMMNFAGRDRRRQMRSPPRRRSPRRRTRSRSPNRRPRIRHRSVSSSR